jgi:hypothetical protein
MPPARYLYAILVTASSEGLHDMLNAAELDYGVRCVHYRRAQNGVRFKIIEEPEAKAPEEAPR